MVKKKRQAKRKQKLELSFTWVKPLLALASVVGSAIGLTLMLDWMNDPRYLPVRQVQVEGQFRHLQNALVQEEVAPVAATGFFAMDVSDMQSRLQALPWVDLVSVRRVWPDRLEIRVREQQAVAYWGDDALMNARAQVFQPQQLPEMDSLPFLQGPQGHEQRVLTMYREMSALLAPLKLSITHLHLSPRRSWDARLSNGLTLDVGRKQPVERVARFVRVYPAILAAGDGQVSAVDLRYSNGFAVQRQATNKTANSAG